MTTTVDFWFDPLCPWAWMTSRWMLEVEQVRDVRTTFHVMSLAVLHEGRERNDHFDALMRDGYPGVRACMAVEDRYGSQGLRDFYTALGTRYHLGGEPKEVSTIRAALEECGFDPGIAELALTHQYDEALRASHHAGMDPVGEDVGTPVLHLNGLAMFGPVMSPAPKGEEAGNVFDGFEKMTAYSGFFELKRTRTIGPIFD